MSVCPGKVANKLERDLEALWYFDRSLNFNNTH